MCTVLLPPGDNPIAVNKYIVSYIHQYAQNSVYFKSNVIANEYNAHSDLQQIPCIFDLNFYNFDFLIYSVIGKGGHDA